MAETETHMRPFYFFTPSRIDLVLQYVLDVFKVVVNQVGFDGPAVLHRGCNNDYCMSVVVAAEEGGDLECIVLEIAMSERIEIVHWVLQSSTFHLPGYSYGMVPESLYFS